MVQTAQVSRALDGAPERFVAVPGHGVKAWVEGHRITVGNQRLTMVAADAALVEGLEAQGNTLLFVTREETLIGILAAADTIRPEVPAALRTVRALGIKRIKLLTGDNARTAAALAGRLGVDYQAGLLPEDKIAVVRKYQAAGISW
jgi:Cu+-exporting ATPase